MFLRFNTVIDMSLDLLEDNSLIMIEYLIRFTFLNKINTCFAKTFYVVSEFWYRFYGCMQDTFARATIGYLVYKLYGFESFEVKKLLKL